ncbi:MAG: YdcF family protein [Erysipelotrichaceae bacterium]|nr:YdcF family protein [Erysipelotrichaceae bacterium]
MKKLKYIFIILLCIIGYILANAFSIYTYSYKDEVCQADVAIVLGAAAYPHSISLVYQERVNHAIDLYNEGYVNKIIMTGGVAEGNELSDAYQAKQYAISCNVPANDILLEETSTITQENLEYAKTIMNEYNYTTAIIVSDPLHMKRAMAMAKDCGITAYTSPTPTTRYQTINTKLPFLIKETIYYIGYKWYHLFSQI